MHRRQSSTMPPTSFVSLPSEIRLHIYQYLLPTSRKDARIFCTTRLICCHIKSEYEHEVGRIENLRRISCKQTAKYLYIVLNSKPTASRRAVAEYLLEQGPPAEEILPWVVRWYRNEWALGTERWGRLRYNYTQKGWMCCTMAELR